MEDFYIKVLHDHGLGNTIQCTPTIIGLAHYYNRKIPIYFELEWLKAGYEKWNLITILDKPQGRLLIDTAESTRHKNTSQSDWKFIYEYTECLLGIHMERPIPRTYIDSQDDGKRVSDYIVVCCGCAPNSIWERHKIPSTETYVNLIQQIRYPIVLVGSQRDYDLYLHYIMEGAISCGKSVNVILDDIRQSIKFIEKAKFIISNDTGNAHVAAVFNKPTYILWKNTYYLKNSTQGKHHTVVMSEHWLSQFPLFLAKWQTQ